MSIKTALVTGSSSGIGLAAAKVLASQGMQVMLHGIEADDIGSVIAAQLADQYGVKTAYCSADVANAAAIEELFTTTIEVFGAVDVLVNNAGIQYTCSTEAFPVEKWDQIIAINLSAAFHTTRLALPLMKANGWGRIINIASVHGLVGSANKSAYVAAKHGLIGFTKVVALEHAEDGITVNAICPGWTDTPLLNHQFEVQAEKEGVSFEEAKLSLIKTKAPYPALVDPAAIGHLIMFLCSDAANAITGASMPIDGAWTAH